MKAAVCREFNAPLTIEDVKLAAPGTGEVQVKINACAVCHSDISYMEGAWGGDLPAVFGHEAAGVVEAVGDGVRNVSPGDHAVVTLVRSCGQCSCCHQGYYGSCEASFPLDETSPLSLTDGGAVVGQGLRTGAFAEAVVVEASQVVAMPKDVPFDAASLLACGVITGFGAVTNTAKVPPGSTVVVVGCGGVGLNAVQGAALAGARMVIAVDLSSDKLDAAMEFGANFGINPEKENARRQVRSLTGGGADFVFVTVRAKAAADQAYGMLRPGGAAVIVGMPASGVKSEFDIVGLANDSKRILGSKMGSSNIHQDIPQLIDMYRQGRLKLDELITGRYSLEEINEAIASVNRGEALRNVIVF